MDDNFDDFDDLAELAACLELAFYHDLMSVDEFKKLLDEVLQLDHKPYVFEDSKGEKIVW